jgi:hypothetical protein
MGLLTSYLPAPHILKIDNQQRKKTQLNHEAFEEAELT